MVEAACHCGAVRLEIDTAPEEVTDCNCSVCRRYGTLWAYCEPAQVRISGPTQTYVWNRRILEFHRCVSCGCVTHWSPVDRNWPRMGVNARLMAPEILAGAHIGQFDGASK